MKSCRNCSHRTEIETAVGVWVSSTEGRCRRFVRTSFDRVTGEHVEYLPCNEAMNVHCNLTAWRPTLWGRIKGFFSC